MHECQEIDWNRLNQTMHKKWTDESKIVKVQDYPQKKLSEDLYRVAQEVGQDITGN